MGVLVEYFTLEGDIEDPTEEEAHRRALENWVAAVFLESRFRVPVRTGTLLASGRVEGEETWRQIIYDCPYAEEVEDGRGRPGEKYYFEGRHYLSGAIDDMIPQFEIFLKLALAQNFKVEEK